MTFLLSREPFFVLKTLSSFMSNSFEGKGDSDKILVFWSKSWVKPLEKTAKFSDYFQMTLLLFKKPSFLSRTSSSLFRRKTNSKKIWPNSLEKCFFEYPKMTCFKSRKTSFLSGTSSNIISRPFFFFF